MDELEAELREHLGSMGVDEDSIDEALAAVRTDNASQGRYHLGPCCGSCQGEYEDGFHGGGVMADGWCCCQDERQPWLSQQ